ncbi:hypothetical protein BJY01DRAFT_183957 [Aspergillus pseudoustus]|uniref:Zn(2)-C6 fungal-type domain-containing protein n=1 Tax=Aspergillus pseudoustus TaxID=1810923 RepID=A0ABR4JZQ5_9EURO
MADARPIRRRHRTALSCAECRRRKVRCDRVKPFCGQCRALELVSACEYEIDPRRQPRLFREPLVPVHRETQHPPEKSHSTLAEVPTPSTGIRGVVSKTRVYGHGHWMNTYSLMEGLSSLQPVGECFDALRRDLQSGKTEVTETIAECKKLARGIKTQRPSRKCLPADIHRSLPERQILNELVELYFMTFELCYRILDYQSFMAEYDAYVNRPTGVESPIVLQLLLIMTIAAPMHGNGNVRRDVAAKARSWLELAQGWLSAPLEKDRFTLSGIQLHCLLLLSRQVNQIGADLVWISAGSLTRMAMQMGFYQDPDFLGEMTVQQKETRRGIWYTILEMNVQAALDSGMPPMISTGDYNTKPPDDTQGTALSEGSHMSRYPFQRPLINSLPLRLHVARVINDMQQEVSYNQVIELGNELALAFRDIGAAVSRAGGSSSQFSLSFCMHLVCRFSLCLHYRYALKAIENPLYAHSRQACLAAALELVSFLQDGLYSCVLRTGGGLFRDILTRGAVIIFTELNAEPEVGISSFAQERNRARQEPLLEAARSVVQYARDRIWLGDMNIKIYVWLSMMMAQVQARLDGAPVKEAVTRAMHESIRTSHNMLKTLAAVVPAEPARGSDLGSWSSSNASPAALDANTDSEFDLLDGIFDFDFTDTQGLSQWAGQTW